MPVQTHQINVQGLSGGIFWSILFAVIFFLVGFSTTGWSLTGYQWTGLWSQCSIHTHSWWNQSWFQAVQAMATIGLIFLLISLLFIFVYMFMHSVSVSKSLLLKLFVIFTFISAICILVALAVYGSNVKKGLHWSYAMTAIGGIFTLIGCILGCVQMKRASII